MSKDFEEPPMDLNLKIKEDPTEGKIVVYEANNIG